MLQLFYFGVSSDTLLMSLHFLLDCPNCSKNVVDQHIFRITLRATKSENFKKEFASSQQQKVL